MTLGDGTLLAWLTLVVWVYLFCAHGRFWRSTPELAPARSATCPEVDIVIPARDEAGTIGIVVASLLAQDYAGAFRVLVVDDSSTDGTAEIARTAAAASCATPSCGTRSSGAARLVVIAGRPKPAGWSGKLWALSEGVAASRAPVLLFADADVVHDPRHLATLVARLEDLAPRVDLVSEMVRLNCSSLAERALVPAFIYFFQMLYPFAKVNDPGSRVAAAAGGTVLIRRTALLRIGGIEAIRGALIDDVTLAQAVKRGGAVYLGHSSLATSIRPYPHFRDIQGMISRTAFTQLQYSGGLLAVALLGLTLVWWVPLLEAVFGRGGARWCGLAAFALGAVSFLPTLRRYRQSAAWSLALPLIALFYMAATLDSALTHWRGGGARWKGRDYNVR
jgi:hopene-associated glycosyltransferase HpnB